MSDYEIVELLEKRGAVMKGSFLLSSGKISDTYVQLCTLLDYPQEFAALCEVLAKKARSSIGDFDVILSPALGAVIVGYEVAKVLGVRYMFCERSDGPALKLRRGFTINSTDRVLIVENVVTTGKSSLETAEIVYECGAKVAGIASLIDRISDNAKPFGELPFVSLLHVKAQEYTQSNAPKHLIDAGPVKPGSRPS